MDEKIVKQIRQNMNAMETSELLKIWEANDQEQYSEEALGVAKQLLEARGEKLPFQKSAKEKLPPEQTDQLSIEKSSLPLSVKLLCLILVAGGILLITMSFLRFLDPSHSRGPLGEVGQRMQDEAIARSPVAGRLGSITGAIGIPSILFLMPCYFLGKRSKRALYYFMTLATVMLGVGLVRFALGATYDFSTAPQLLGLILFILFPLLTFYVWFRYRSMFI